jgi:hypothetical protein
MPRDKDTQIADLRECLAGFMVTAKLNGAYVSDEMLHWCAKHLQGKQRTPVQVWNEVVADEKD